MNIKSIKNITIALFLGAIGSGIWSLVGEPFVSWFVETFISAAQSINAGYYDLLHKNIGKGLHEENGVFFRSIYSSLMLVVVIALPIFSFSLISRLKNLEKEKIENEELVSLDKSLKSTKYFFIAALIIAILGTPIYISRLIASGYNNEAIVFIERSIDILSPHVEYKQALRYRADYREISDASSFYALHDKLQDTAKKFEITLPDIDIAK